MERELNLLRRVLSDQTPITCLRTFSMRCVHARLAPPRTPDLMGLFPSLACFSSCGPRSRVGPRGGRSLAPRVVLAWGSSSRTFLASWSERTLETVWGQFEMQKARQSLLYSPTSGTNRRSRYVITLSHRSVFNGASASLLNDTFVGYQGFSYEDLRTEWDSLSVDLCSLPLVSGVR